MGGRRFMRVRTIMVEWPFSSCQWNVSHGGVEGAPFPLISFDYPREGPSTNPL